MVMQAPSSQTSWKSQRTINSMPVFAQPKRRLCLFSINRHSFDLYDSSESRFESLGASIVEISSE